MVLIDDPVALARLGVFEEGTVDSWRRGREASCWGDVHGPFGIKHQW